MAQASAVRRFADSSSGIAVAMAIMNVATYGFVVLASPLLGTNSFGALTATLNVLLVISVASLGLQATAARRIASAPEHVAQIEDSIMRVTYRAAFALGVLLLLLSPVINAVLKLDSPAAALIMATTAVPLTIFGGQIGVLQGERRWAHLGLMYMANGLGRFTAGAVCILLDPTFISAVVGIGIGFWIPVVLGWWLMRHDRTAHEPVAENRPRSLLMEAVRNSQALLAFFALSSLDIVVARNTLSEHQAGLYAAGLILTKAMLFLPQFVVVVAFPSMSQGSERRRALTLSLTLISVLGAVGTLAAWLLSGIALRFVGGSGYVEVQSKLWLFAIIGTLLAMIQLLVYSVLARQGRLAVYAVWVALAAMLGLGLMADTLVGLATRVIAVDAALLVALLAVTVVVLRRDEPVVDESVPTNV